LEDTKASREVRILETFFKTLQNDASRAYYGEKHVFRASEAQAIETLLISDKLFRAQDVGVRKKFVKLVDDVSLIKIFN
jgi:protein pelota